MKTVSDDNGRIRLGDMGKQDFVNEVYKRKNRSNWNIVGKKWVLVSLDKFFYLVS